MAILFEVLLTSVLLTRVQAQNVQVSIPDGILQGSVLIDYDDTKFYGFTRIPYARPPLGDYRFKLPEKNEPWEGVLDATQESPACIQPNRALTDWLGEEDCLYLNVFTKYANQSAQQPVLIYIHGGNFYQGKAADYGPEFLLTQDIVLVTINYRLGVYGFINTMYSNLAVDGDTEMIGNNAMKDQVMALKWVQRNIEYFGGNPNAVTISGQNAGGMSAHAHMLSPLSAGLFHRVIAISGIATAVTAMTKIDSATPLAKHLGYNTTNFDAMMQDLRNASHDDLFNAAKALKWFDLQLNSQCVLCMVIEKPSAKSFISDYPFRIIRRGRFSKVPLMLGWANRDGLLTYAKRDEQANLKELATHIPFYFRDVDGAMRRVQRFYNLDSIDDKWNLIDFYTDAWIRYEIVRTARAHAEAQNQFDIHFAEFSGDAKLNHMKLSRPSIAQLYGAANSDELGYLFQIAGVPTSGSVEESLMRNIVKIWGNFAKTGRPSSNPFFFRCFININVNITNSGIQINIMPYSRSTSFWDNMYMAYSNGYY